MKKTLCLLCALVLMLVLPLGALAQIGYPAECGVEGHHTRDGLNHNRPQSCWVKGHNYCDGLNHERAACGTWAHYNCDDRDHAPAACGAAGHFACEARKHSHDKPISKYCNAVPQHMVCQGDQLHYCDPAQGGCGDTYPCSRSNAHTPCRMCGKGLFASRKRDEQRTGGPPQT